MAEIDLTEHFDLLNSRVDDGDFVREQKARAEMLKAARAYYDGYHKRPLKARKGERDPNIIINLCRKIVDKSVAWLFGDAENGQRMKFELPAPQAEDTTAEPLAADTKDPTAEAETYLAKVWEANGGAGWLLKVGRRVGITGHGFVKLVPQDDESNTTELPQLILLRPEAVSVLTQEDNADALEAYVIEWSEKRKVDNRTRDVKLRQFIALVEGEWVVASFSNTGTSKKKWVSESDPEKWPHTWPPIVDWQNLTNDDGYYGLSDLEDLTVINDGINMVVSNTNRILEIHGHPRTVGTGFEAKEVQDTSIDAFWTIGKPDAKVYNLEMQSDLSSAFNFLQFLSQAFENIGRDVDLMSLQDRIGQVTNFGLRVLANDAFSKLSEKRLSYGGAINRINRALLELGGYEVQDTVIHWLNPLPEDGLEESKRLQLEMDMEIVSRETAATERGREWTTEQPRIEADKLAQADLGTALLEAFDKGGAVNPLRKSRPAVDQQQ